MLFATVLLYVVLGAPLALCLGGIWASGFYESRARRERARMQRPDARGQRTLWGLARPLHGSSDEPLVTHTIKQKIAGGVGGLRWATVGSSVSGAPFLLTLPGGEAVEVDATSFELRGFPATVSAGPSPGLYLAPPRFVTSVLSPEDEVWVTGVLTRPESLREGAYRHGGRAKLRPPVGEGGAVLLAKAPPWEPWSALAGAYRRGALVALLGEGINALVFGTQARLGRVLGGSATLASSDGMLALVLGSIVLALVLVQYRKGLSKARGR